MGCLTLSEKSWNTSCQLKVPMLRPTPASLTVSSVNNMAPWTKTEKPPGWEMFIMRWLNFKHVEPADMGDQHSKTLTFGDGFSFLVSLVLHCEWDLYSMIISENVYNRRSFLRKIFKGNRAILQCKWPCGNPGQISFFLPFWWLFGLNSPANFPRLFFLFFFWYWI